PAHRQWLVPWNAWPGLILPSWTVTWLDFSSPFIPNDATELACGLIPPVALLSSFIVNGRALLKKIRWELALLLLLLFLAMLPTAGIFRWSFRWQMPAVGSIARDRKSTRLNSSHVKISYAVFCLKKKKKKHKKKY